MYGEPQAKVPLPDFFADDEWAFLKSLSDKTNNKIHDGALPTTRNGKRFVIVSHSSLEVPDYVDRFQEIAIKAAFTFEKGDLLVKDEAILSGSTGSDSSSPDKEIKL